MTFDLRPEAEMEGLEQAGRELDAACRRAGISPEMTGWVVAAAMSALSAALLAGATGPVLVLDKGLSQVTLRLECSLPPESRGATPPGLAAGLFSPPALQATCSDEGDRMVWTVVWEA